MTSFLSSPPVHAERQEFDVFLTRDTPRVTVGTVEVIVGTNIPATAECRLSRSGFRQTVDCELTICRYNFSYTPFIGT